MDYEKLYKEAIERAKSWAKGEHPECFSEAQKAVDFIFPELKESEDERIKKEIIKLVKFYYGSSLVHKHTVSKDDMLAWLEKQGQEPKKVSIWKHWKDGIAGNGEGEQIYLIKQGNTYHLSSCLSFECDYIKLSELDKLEVEKQGEQKPADKVEPKFKVGDWCIDNEDGTIFQIVKVLDNSYIYKTNEGKEYSCSHYSLEIDAKLWTIQDAKDGDVLAEDSCMFIIEKMKSEGLAIVHCCLFDDGYFDLIGSTLCFDVYSTYPATKEQRDLLFQKMKESGYEWNAEKKELKKIEQKSAWSEEDEYQINTILHGFDLKREIYKKEGNKVEEERYNTQYNWLKSLKDRMKGE